MNTVVSSVKNLGLPGNRRFFDKFGNLYQAYHFKFDYNRDRTVSVYIYFLKNLLNNSQFFHINFTGIKSLGLTDFLLPKVLHLFHDYLIINNYKTIRNLLTLGYGEKIIIISKFIRGLSPGASFF